MIKFAIDVTWVRHKIVGGTEPFVHNLIRGFMDSDLDYEMTMITALDNREQFQTYTQDKRIHLVSAPVNSAAVSKRILWQNRGLSRLILNHGINLCLEPVYAKPVFGPKKLQYITVIHDLEALYFPQYHSFLKNKWLRFSWKNTVKTSRQVVSISEFVRQDIINRYGVRPERVTTIYDPIYIDVTQQCDFSVVENQYGVKDGEYFYTVSKLNPHKNLTTLVKTFGEIKKRRVTQIPCKLLISGVNGGMAEQLVKIAAEYGLKDEIVLTGFVDDNIRNTLYAHARAFLFPSVFEGFGMPPVEAMSLDTPVITTREASIPETTQHLANYVDDPYSPDDWIGHMLNIKNRNAGFSPEVYSPVNIASQYYRVLAEVRGRAAK